MPYTVLRGQFVIRYPDLPRQGPEPDGDTVKFRPDTPGLVEMLPRRSGRPPQINARGVSVRLEAIDALETHFAETHQELVGANAARDALLARLGFTQCRVLRRPAQQGGLGRCRRAPRVRPQQRHRRQRPDDRLRLSGRAAVGGRFECVPRRSRCRRLGERVPASRRPGLPGLLRHAAGIAASRISQRRRAPLVPPASGSGRAAPPTPSTHGDGAGPRHLGDAGDLAEALPPARAVLRFGPDQPRRLRRVAAGRRGEPGRRAVLPRPAGGRQHARPDRGVGSAGPDEPLAGGLHHRARPGLPRDADRARERSWPAMSRSSPRCPIRSASTPVPSRPPWSTPPPRRSTSRVGSWATGPAGVSRSPARWPVAKRSSSCSPAACSCRTRVAR